jgi:hypothetical protein
LEREREVEPGDSGASSPEGELTSMRGMESAPDAVRCDEPEERRGEAEGDRE